MKEQIISFKTAKLAKEKGFDWPCKLHYSSNKDLNSSKQRITHKSLRSGGFLAPTQSLLQKLLREKYNIQIDIECDHSDEGIRYFGDVLKYKNEILFVEYSVKIPIKRYENVLEELLLKALNLIKS